MTYFPHWHQLFTKYIDRTWPKERKKEIKTVKINEAKMGENEHFVILKKRPPESVNILKYIRQLASKVEQSIRVRVTYRVWPAVVQWGWLGVATVCYTFTCRTISPHV